MHGGFPSGGVSLETPPAHAIRPAQFVHECPKPDIDGGWGLPTNLFWAVRRLDLHPADRAITAKHLWPGLVVDTILFAKRGWAAKALALGWTETELFALSPTGRWQGLTSRLLGSPIIALDAEAVTIREGSRPYRLRRNRPSADAIMIWELGI